MAQNHELENTVITTKIQEKIQRLKKNKLHYELLEEKLKASGEPQISITDEDSRVLLVQGQEVEVSYNIQAAVDAQYNLAVATHTINRNDHNALSAIAIEAKENGSLISSILGSNSMLNVSSATPNVLTCSVNSTLKSPIMKCLEPLRSFFMCDFDLKSSKPRK